MPLRSTQWVRMEDALVDFSTIWRSWYSLSGVSNQTLMIKGVKHANRLYWIVGWWILDWFDKWLKA